MGKFVTYHPGITVGVVVVHASSRNARTYYCEMEESVSTYFGDDRQKVYLISPKFHVKADHPAKGTNVDGLE